MKTDKTTPYPFAHQAEETFISADLFYLWTLGCDLLLSRIRQRVAAGGHTVPDQDVRRRRERSVENLKGYAEVMDNVRVFDNSEASPVLVYEKNGAALVYDEERFVRIQKELGL